MNKKLLKNLLERELPISEAKILYLEEHGYSIELVPRNFKEGYFLNLEIDKNCKNSYFEILDLRKYTDGKIINEERIVEEKHNFSLEYINHLKNIINVYFS